MERTVHVSAGGGYDVRIDRGLLARCGEAVRQSVGGAAAALIADAAAGALYGAAVEHSLRAAGYRVCRRDIAPGEQSKNGQEFLRLLEWCAEQELTRTDVIVALGGGVTGDLAGFAAACYLRGVPVVQLPTTLLAMVDASVGGKTAIDLAAGKNLAGAFYQPSLVLCDPETLHSLPQEVFAGGMAETIKYGMLYDPALLAALGADYDLDEVIARCVGYKRDAVEQDERDTGARQLLNLGHTEGHAIETLSDFAIPHGQTVAAGMAIVTRAAEAQGDCEPGSYEQLEPVLRRHSLPVGTGFALEDLTAVMRRDKKRAGDEIALVIPRRVGLCQRKLLPVDALEDYLWPGAVTR